MSLCTLWLTVSEVSSRALPACCMFGLLEFLFVCVTKALMQFSEKVKVFIISDAGPAAEAVIL